MRKVTKISCSYCGTEEGPFHNDHVVPRSRGGPDTPHNLVKACASCNRAKHDSLPSEWLKIVPTHVAAIEDRVAKCMAKEISAKRSWKQQPSTLVCWFCGHRLTDVEDSFVEFFDQETFPFKIPTATRFNSYGGREEYGALARPGYGKPFQNEGLWNGWRTIGVYEHGSCGTQWNGKWVSFSELLDGHYKYLKQFMLAHRWFSDEFHGMFDHVRRDGRRLKGATKYIPKEAAT